jgi:hypothetical protein
MAPDVHDTAEVLLNITSTLFKRSWLIWTVLFLDTTLNYFKPLSNLTVYLTEWQS